MTPETTRGRLAALPAALLAALLLAGCSDPASDPARDGAPVVADLAADLHRTDQGQGDAPLTPPDAADLGADLPLMPDAAGSDLSPTDTVKVTPPLPAAYDCTSVKLGPPARATAVPLGCILDPKCSTRLVTAHRGAGTDSQALGGFYLPIGKFAPENTLLAIRWAIVVGADVVEIDVRTTKDGHLVLIHDDEVERTTQGKGKVAQLTLSQLQALKIKTAQFKGDFSCAQIPTLTEALALTKGRINIDADLKTNDTDKVALAVKQAGLLDQVFFSSDSKVKLALARKTVPGVRLQARTKVASEIPVLLAAFSPPPEIMEIGEGILTPANIAMIHAKGAKVFADGFFYDVQGYLTNDPKSYQAFVAKKADIMQVDRADLLLTLLGR